jgi:hypothetical protein
MSQRNEATVIYSGMMGMGSALAMIISWHFNSGSAHPILWAILHGICSWFYVIYAALEKW